MEPAFTFYVGAPEPSWLWRFPGPWCVSDNRLRRVVRLHPLLLGSRWFLDSGAFTRLRQTGSWSGVRPGSPGEYQAERKAAREYARRARRYHDAIGGMSWAAIMDWPCEEPVRLGGRWKGMHFAGTGLSVAEHQRRTVDSYHHLMEAEPSVPWKLALQGTTVAELEACAALFESEGVATQRGRTIGIGSVCSRQSEQEITDLLTPLWLNGFRMHGFGLKTLGLARCGWLMDSADSQACYFHARRRGMRLDGCTHRGPCSYCPRWAGVWRGQVLAKMGYATPHIMG